jgi:predicted metal-dependent enzyme (double-stranded beta helix superfamily)
MGTFSIEAFAAGCTEAMKGEKSGRLAAKAYLQRTLREHDTADIVAALEAAIPAGASVGEMIVHRSAALTLLYARVPARFQSGIHNHTVCAVIGQLVGEERSVVYDKNDDGTLRVRETITTRPGEVMSLTADAIHHIENPGDETSRALHVYGGDFGALMDQRSLWSPGDHREGPFSFEALLAQSVVAMKQSGNAQGLTALAEAVPAAAPLIAAE